MGELTSEQEKAITTEGFSLAVSAGAGSGKTRVLVDRYMHLLKTKDWDMRQLVAITFTEKAAREMRNRIRQMINEEDGKAEENEYKKWRYYQERLDGARISTIHSFCESLLRANPAEARVDPRFDIIEEVDADILLGDVIEEVLSEAKFEDKELKLLREYGVKRVRDILYYFVNNRYEIDEIFSCYQLNNPDGISRILQRWQQELEELKNKKLAELLNDPSIQDRVEFIRNNRALDPVDRMEIVRRSLIDILNGLNKDKTSFIKSLSEFLNNMNLSGGSAKNWGSKDNLSRIKEALRTIRELYEDKSDILSREIDEGDKYVAHLLPFWERLYRKVCDRFSAYKDEANYLDFADLQISAYRMLKEYPEVLKRYRDEIKTIMVDEFQDVNELQKDIVYLLTEMGEEQGRLFVVGDDKQSIYRFRGADVTVFKEVKEELRRKGAPEINLNTSFRSQKRLLDFFNHIFAQIFKIEGRKPYPFEAEFQSLSAYRQKRTPERCVELHLIHEVDEEGNKSKVEEIRKAEARALARRVRELVEIERIKVEDNARWREARYNDIAMLFKVTTDFPLYEEALKDEGIPFVTISGRGFYEHQEVKDILNLLRVLNNPYDDLSLAGILRSPLFSLSDESLYILRKNGYHFWDAIRDNLDGLSEEERGKAKLAEEVLRRLSRVAGKVSIFELLLKAMEETGYSAVLTGLFDGPRRRGNVEKLLELAKSTKEVILSEFITYVETLSQMDDREGEATIEVDNAVRLMSIHKAKGLEFPIVILPTAISQGSKSLAPILAIRDYGIAAKRLDREEGRLVKTTAYLIAEAREEEMDRAETNRLLYVALTRARDYLIISGKTGGKDDWLSQILGALNIDHNGEGDISFPWGKIYIKHYEVISEESPLSDESSLWDRECVIEGEPAELSQDLPQAVIPSLTAFSPSSSIRSARIFYSPTSLRNLIKSPISTKSDKEKDRDELKMKLGTIVHSSLEYWIFPGEEGFEDFIEKHSLKEGIRDENDKRSIIEKATSMLIDFQKSDMYHEINEAEIRRRELPFNYLWRGKIINGIIDILYKNREGKWVIVDFKTDDITAEQVREYSRIYAVQLGLYARAVKDILGEEPLVYLYYLTPQISFELGREVRESYLERVGRLLEYNS